MTKCPVTDLEDPENLQCPITVLQCPITEKGKRKCLEITAFKRLLRRGSQQAPKKEDCCHPQKHPPRCPHHCPRASRCPPPWPGWGGHPRRSTASPLPGSPGHRGPGPACTGSGGSADRRARGG